MARSACSRYAPVVLALLGACAHRSKDTTSSSQLVRAVDVLSDERLGVDDVFVVRVIGEPDLTSEYRIAADGTIDFPYIGRITVAGMPPGEVQRNISKKLREGYFRSPQITLLVKEWNSRKITILGQVMKPGAVAYSPGMTLMDAIAAVGGFTPLAAANSVKLRREVDGRIERSTLRVGDISEGRSPNVVLLPGDAVFVDERLF